MPDIYPLTGKVEILQAAASKGGKPARVAIVANTGGLMYVPGIGLMLIDLSGLDITRPVQILAEHKDTIDGLLGTGTATKTATDLRVDGPLSYANPLTATIVAMNKDGVQFSASVGVEPLEREFIHEGNTVSANGRTVTAPRDGFVFVKRGILRETSLLALGADADTSVAIAASHSQPKGVKTMPNETNQDVDFTKPEHFPNEMRAAWDRDGVPDADRIEARLAAFRREHSDELPDFGRGMVLASASGSLTWGDAEREILRAEVRALQLRAIRDERPMGPAIHSSTRDQSPAVLTAAFCQSAGLPDIENHFDAPTLEAAHTSFRGGVGLGEMLLHCAREGGYSGRGAVRAGNLQEILRAAFSVHSLTTLLSTTGNKFLSVGFNSVEQTWKAISKIRAVKNFKEVTSYRLTSDLEFEELPPAGEIKHGTVGQESYTVQAKTYAKMLTLTRTDIINDDLGAFDDLRNRMGRGSALKLNSIFWSSFLDNASFFTEARGNLQTGAATALAENGTALAAAEKLFLDLSDDDGHPLGITPALILLPTALSVIGRKLYVSQEMRDTTSSTTYQTANLFHNRFRPLTSAYIGSNNDNGSDTQWFLLADASNLPTMEVAFLDGNESPTIESADADFQTLGIQTRGYFDFGCSLAEWRAGVASDGTD